MSEPLLRAGNLTLRFGGNTVLDDVSFDVGEGELFAVIGPNGAGKTSTFNCISGVYRPQQGSITFRGRPLTGLRPDRVAGLGIARTFQNIELFENLTVLDNLLLGRHQQLRAPWWQAMAWLPRARRAEYAARREVEYIIDFLELEAVRHAPVGILPYGIKKRIELGRALAMDPQLLLLDEPVAGMSHEERDATGALLHRIAGERTVVVIEHDMDFLRSYARTVSVLHAGRVLSEGTVDEVRADPAVQEVYLGTAEDAAAVAGAEAVTGA